MCGRGIFIEQLAVPETEVFTPHPASICVTLLDATWKCKVSCVMYGKDYQT